MLTATAMLDASPTTLHHASPSAALPLGLDLASYTTIIVAFSGGKDSLACLLLLLDLGVSPDRIELWHHDIDGREGSDLMDWACTRDYCAQVAKALGIRIYYSWREGGFEREMLRDGTRTASTLFEEPIGRPTLGGRTRLRRVGGKNGPLGRRRKFPQVSANLAVRWCSASLKIDIGSAAIRNQDRFRDARTLVLTGERAEESAARAKYHAFEADRSDGRDTKHRRHVDRWRAVLHWTEAQVWSIIARYRINPHPAYRLGWGRVSCMACIFGSAAQWASVKELAPQTFERIAQYEEQFGATIHRKESVRKRAVEQMMTVQLVVKGKAKRSRQLVVVQPYQMADVDKRAALSRTFDEPAILPEGTWKLPKGAFGESCGPT